MALGAVVSDIFAGFGEQAKAQYDITEGQIYGQAATLARQNAQFTKMSTGIKEAQADREAALAIGRIHGEVAGAGFAESGSALDILRSSTQQAALQHAVVGEQGLITEAGYREQAASYDLMQQAAGQAASAEKTAAIGSFIAAGVDFGASFLPGGGGGGGSGDGTVDIPVGAGGDFVGA